VSDVFSGRENIAPQHIRDALGWLEPADEEVIPKLIGAVMTLCLAVQTLEAKLTSTEQGGAKP